MKSLVVYLLAAGCAIAQEAGVQRIPIIDVTDLYHPFQDPGDNFDLVTAYALANIDLRAVILDATDGFRKPVADVPGMWHDPDGPREPGVIAVMQLNYLFDRTVPFAPGPFSLMKSLDDPMRDIPRFQQQGIELLLRTLAESSRAVDILSFGSLRTVAAAYNRDPELFRRRVRRIHVSAGSATENYELGSSAESNEIAGGEWNVALDPLAFIRIMRSGLPIDWYPCATKDGAFERGVHNTYWSLPDLRFIAEMAPQLKNYLDFAFSRSMRPDFLRAMDAGAPDAPAPERYSKPHHVWETAVWMNAAHLQLVRRADAHYRLRLPGERVAGDQALPAHVAPCDVKVRDDGRVSFRLSRRPEHIAIYTRPDPAANEEALREALPALYKSFRVP